ncbi:glycosyltransferase [Desulfosporosinus acidiphilus SJ4]|uniref:Glycosyltransferase n=1 Tax=Desulfosporosinus acidiphilus (strain DSM 22704 / JCM 16185 / SJ4) TaxID=646529 RepID=I4D1J8_DESAJ|nr:glycosyltransferase family 4 protein [Desulfosporosinus acidiphilus]AFM39672.1 glycosyltransferase [Desulfosporosinus acidiphilus SJ4]
MNVLSLTNEFEEESFGGAGTAVSGILHLFNRLGVGQTVIVPRSDLTLPRWELRGLQLKVLGLPRNSQYFGNLGMIKAETVLHEFPELNQRWDLIHCHAINFTSLAYTLSGGVIPILYSVYSFLRKELGDRAEAELQAQFNIQEDLLLRCRRIHVISQSERNYLLDRFPRYLSKTEVVSLGISRPPQCWEPKTANEFLYVGRLLNYKGIEDLILAINLVRQSGRQVRLNIIGKAADSSYESRLRSLVNSRKLGASVKFLGWLPSSEVWRSMGQAAGLVVPSRREAFGLVALEGMAIGVPVIASGAGGLAELVTDACGLTFEPGNIKQLANTLRKAIDHPAILRSLAIRGHEKAASLEWERLAPRYLMLLNFAK